MREPTFSLQLAPIGGLPLSREPEEDAALGLAARLVTLSVAITQTARRAEARA